MLGTYNIDVAQLEAALSPSTKAVMLAHTLGNPFDLDAVRAFCDAHELWLIEDNCDALGGEYRGRKTGTFGDIGTSSFYPPHHMTMGEGGAVYTDNDELAAIMLSMRDWGRDCWLPLGQGQHLRQALLASSSARCPSATTTSTSTPTSATTSRRPTCRRRSAWRSSRSCPSSPHAADANYAYLREALAPARGRAHHARGDRGRRPVAGSAT